MGRMQPDYAGHGDHGGSGVSGVGPGDIGDGRLPIGPLGIGDRVRMQSWVRLVCGLVIEVDWTAAKMRQLRKGHQ